MGDIAEGLLLPYPSLRRSEQDQLHAYLGEVRRFCAKNVDSARIDKDEALSAELLDGLKQLGLFGLGVPAAHGGKGLRTFASARVVQELGGIDSSIAVTVGTHVFIGLRGLQLFGSEALCATYLQAAARGDKIASFALSEASAGSDASAIRLLATPKPDGYVLNGQKVWVTNGGIADLFTVFARTSPADGDQKPRLTAFLLPRGPGVTTGASMPKLGVRGSSTTTLTLDNVFVPHEAVLLAPGKGFKVAVEVLNDGRLGLAAGCIGAAKRLLKLSVDRCKERRAFGRSIGEFGLVKDKLAQMTALTYALESATYLTAGLAEAGHDYSIESAICKVLGSEALWHITDVALQIAAGVGYAQGAPFERLLRDARVNLVYTGTNDILRCFIALSGMQGPGTELSGSISELARAMREPIKGFGLLSDLALRKAKEAFSRDRVMRVHPVLAREVVILEEYTQDLARSAEKVLRRHGRNIAEMQFTQRRIADMAIDLYATAACIARAQKTIEERGEEGARREVDLTVCFVREAERRLKQNSEAFDKNDDELRKTIASKTLADGGYPLDVV
jgi:acyl-CoA dehydrogenase family protein 9